MKVNLSQKDWMLISAYLDGRLTSSEITRMDTRLKADAQFHQAYVEIKNTRRLLRSLPKRRAPRNFTLSQSYTRSRAKRWGLNSYFGLASAVTILALFFVFASANHFFMQPSLMAAAPEMVMLDSSASTAADENATPMIITWGQNDQAYSTGGANEQASGLGGGGGSEPDPNAKSFVSEPVLPQPETETSTMMSTETPLMTAEEDAAVDPSTLILGIQEPEVRGEVIDQSTSTSMKTAAPLAASTLWMICLGGLSLACACLAIFLRRR